MNKLPEELVGYISQEQWDTFIARRPIKIGSSVVNLVRGGGSYYFLQVSNPVVFNITCSPSNPVYAWNAIYAGLQLLSKDPEYLFSEVNRFGKSCLTLGFPDLKPAHSPLEVTT